ncbi:acyltransferase [Blastococcus sp. TF02A-26]|uniref:acyltransferase family protein n=1 Tax=Blastococcus sp. TF02A-26 TaxID=2250577 RepID=UPI000DE9258D|nr:acyltransferase [Blastococcus sp. TF02A-26]RBY86135.1 acyltransferase [Blastococcus sp. TF02A-26]
MTATDVGARVPGAPGAGPVPAGPIRDVARLRALDGLRGVAALVVVVHHLLLVLPAVSDVVDVDGTGAEQPTAWSAQWWLARTPLRLVWAGEEAVLLFFVLSGLVLTLPVLRGWGRRDWMSYYARRLVRLYLPVWAAVVFALGLALAVTRDVTAESGWMAIHRPPTLRALAFDGTLLFGTSNLDSPLWSLRWEVWFSLLLPLVVALVCAIRIGRWWPAVVTGLALGSAAARLPGVGEGLPAGELVQGLLTYLPVFGIGVVLASALPEVTALAAGVGAAGRARPAALFAAALLLTVAPALGDAGTAPAPTAVALRAAGLLGVVGLILLALGWPALRRGLERRPVQWLGSRSFSLYLVHEPLLVAAALLLGGPSVAQWGLVAVPVLLLALVTAEVFHRAVEGPAHRLARRVGEWPRRPAAAVAVAD